MIEFKKGEIYTFGVVGIRESSDEKKYIYLSDGEKETYRVTPYDFQMEWEDSNRPKFMQCLITDVSIWGLPTLAQVRWNVLSECYEERESEYSFKLLEIREDVNTKASYYYLKDPFGIVHRYYPKREEKRREVGDIFSLLFHGIQEKEDNSDYLILSPVEDFESKKEDKAINIDSTESENYDPRNESLFGREDDITEFKRSIVYPADETEPNIDKQILIIAKTIAGFQNRNGGKLYLGVNDSGNVVGINNDYEYLGKSEYDKYTYQKNIDGYENKVRNSVKHLLGQVSNSNIMLDSKKENNTDYCIITINKVLKPIFLNGDKLYERTGQLTQLLKGDAITWFIEQRMMERNNIKLSETKDYILEVSDEEIKLDEEIVERVPLPDTNISLHRSNLKAVDIIRHLASDTVEADKIWSFITFYKDGGWSYQSKPISDDTVEYELPITYSLRKERLAICYDNGRVNLVVPYDIIKQVKTKGKKYKNGWNTKAKIIGAWNLHADDLLAFTSIDEASIEYVKIHRLKAISLHDQIYSEGNVLINENYGAKISTVKPILQKYQHFVSSLICKDNQKTRHIGIKRSDRDFKNVFHIMDSI